MVRADERPEEPPDRPAVRRVESGDETVWTIGTGHRARELKIRPAQEADDTEYAWVLCVDGEPNEFSDSRAELEDAAREWCDVLND